MHLNRYVTVAALAGLLHDVGKVCQRAHRNDKGVLGASLGMSDQVRRGKNSYAHCLWTDWFIGRLADDSAIIDAAGNRSDLANAAVFHHNARPDHALELIIQLADRASAGMDRDRARDEDRDPGRYLRRPLESLFSKVRIGTGDEATPDTFYDLSVLTPRSAFPREGLEDISSSYADLLSTFEKAIGAIDTRDTDYCLEAVTGIVRRHLWCVPSSTVDMEADISLADHLTTTAAIASAMAAQYAQEGVEPHKSRFRLISGDVRGIQKFIFALSGESRRNIAKLLRGRSFTVGILTKVIAREMCRAAGVPSLCCIVDAGGRFSVLLPDTRAAIAGVGRVREEMERWLYERFFADLQVVVDDGVVLGLEDFDRDRLPEVLNRSARSLMRARNRLFAGILEKKDGPWVDNERYAAYHAYGQCRICGREPAEADGTGSNCHGFIELGRRIAGARYVTLHESREPTALLGRIGVKPAGEHDDTDVSYRINAHLEPHDMQWRPSIDYAVFRPEKESDEFENGDVNRNKTFVDMATASEGLEALAVLKADVDNLGYIMQAGFGGRDSISRRVGLSRMLNYFFAGWLPSRLSEKKRYRNCYTLFAGGDDLCLIGPWDAMVSLAAEVHEEFARFCGHNPEITLSAGIELFKPGFPVVRAVDAAEKLLEKAKEEGRDRIHAFGCAMRWQPDFAVQRRFAHDWRRFVDEREPENEGYTGTAMLYRFLRYYREYKACDPDSLHKLRHRFQFIYDINRNLKPSPKALREGAKDWRLERPFVDLQVTRTKGALEGLPLFEHLAAGISIAAYANRKKQTL